MENASPSAAPDPLHLDQQLCFAAYTAAHAFAAAYKPVLEPLGLTYPQYLVLLVLWTQDGLSVKEIGTQLHLDSGTLTPILKRMEGAGLLKRRRDPNDERHLRIALTEQGRAVRDTVATARERVVCALGGDEKPIQQLKDELHAVAKKLRESL
ncbi:MAG TPA: MarR family transcriptional regulator [Beijerinckiaceae bacterium]|jgi:DNA-binding MarR family transcriptional regulator